MTRPFRRLYRAHPLHLLVLLATFALAGYAVVKLVPSNPVGIIAWFIGAAVGHDIALLPLYALVDSGLVRVWRRHHDRQDELPHAPWINYIRFPAAISGLLLLIFAPLIFRLSPGYTAITGLSADPYITRWLLITAALFAISAVCFAVRLRRST